MKLFILISAALFLAGCSTSKDIVRADIEPVENNNTSAEGIYYHLPATILKIEVTAQKVTEKRGPYYRYSQRYLNLSDIITEDRTEWQLTDARIYSEGIPDGKKLFRIEAKGAPAGAAVNLTPEGILKGLNSDAEKANLKKPESKSITNQESTEENHTFDDIPLTEEQLRKTSGAATAEEVAAEIYNLRDSRQRLLESNMQELPPDHGAYDKILKGIDKLEQQYLSLFKGKKDTETVKKTFTFQPDSSSPANQVLFRFSSKKGFTDTTDMTGTPVYIDIKTDSIPENPYDIPPVPEKERGGLVYCRPSKATVKIIDRTVLLTEDDILIGQYGQLHRLPASLLDNPATSIKLDPTTGALLNIQINQKK